MQALSLHLQSHPQRPESTLALCSTWAAAAAAEAVAATVTTTVNRRRHDCSISAAAAAAAAATCSAASREADAMAVIVNYAALNDTAWQCPVVSLQQHGCRCSPSLLPPTDCVRAARTRTYTCCSRSPRNQ